MSCVFESLFSNRLYEFIQQKNAVGFPYTESTRLLSEFDRFCLEQFPDEATLTKEICLAWAIRRDTEGNNTFRNRLMPVREFARYLNRCGEPAFVLHPNFAKKGPRHIPHIYSEEEIVALWEALNQLKPRKGYPIRHFVIPTLVRLLYCCGLRPCEARKLRVTDVDLKKGRLDIMESKGHKSRIVMMADDVTEMCRRYDEAVSEKENVRQQGRRYKEPNEPMFALTVCDRHGIIRYGKVRKLMPIECWRLQGFTDEQFYKAVNAGIKDGQLYKMAGNAVSVPVVSALGRKIKEIEERSEKEWKRL